MANLTLLLTFLSVIFASLTSGFLLQPEECIVKSPCTCALSRVDCTNLNLTHLPTFVQTKQQWGYVLILLQGNGLASLPNDGFRALRHTDSRNVHIVLGSNALINIEPNAFRGIENSVQYLNLSDNRLDHLPSALGQLHNLHFLYIQGNPLTSLDPSIMSTLGTPISHFSFSASAMTVWPQSLQSLTSLSQLTVNQIKLKVLPDDAFNGLNTTLASLTIESSNLVSIPEAVCSLTYLAELEFNFNLNVDETGGGILPDCLQNGSQLLRVGHVVLDGNDLMDFPKVLFAFPNLRSLEVTGNPHLQAIHISDLTQNATLNTLILNNNNITDIPDAFQMLQSLQALELKGNGIMAIKSHAFQMAKLVRLFLNDNPLTTIDSAAFDFLPSLLAIHLGGTRLTSVPRALTSLPSLHTVWLPDGIYCTCALKWMTSWQVVIPTGSCQQSGKSVSAYIHSDLANC